jgi:hypothetical protein
MSVTCSRATVCSLAPLLAWTYAWRGLATNRECGVPSDEQGSVQQSHAQKQSVLPSGHVHDKVSWPKKPALPYSQDWSNVRTIQRLRYRLPWPRSMNKLPGGFTDTRNICALALSDSFLSKPSNVVARNLWMATNSAMALITDPIPPSALSKETRDLKARLETSLDQRLPRAFRSIVRAVHKLSCTPGMDRTQRVRKVDAIRGLSAAGGVHNLSLLSAALRIDGELVGIIRELVDQTVDAAKCSVRGCVSPTFTDFSKALLILRQCPALAPDIINAEAEYLQFVNPRRIADFDLTAIAATLKLLAVHVGPPQADRSGSPKSGVWCKDSTVGQHKQHIARVMHLADAAKEILAKPNQAHKGGDLTTIAHALAHVGLSSSLTLVMPMQSHMRVIHNSQGLPRLGTKNAIDWLDTLWLLGLEAEVAPTQVLIFVGPSLRKFLRSPGLGVAWCYKGMEQITAWVHAMIGNLGHWLSFMPFSSGPPQVHLIVSMLILTDRFLCDGALLRQSLLRCTSSTQQPSA